MSRGTPRARGRRRLTAALTVALAACLAACSQTEAGEDSPPAPEATPASSSPASFPAATAPDAATAIPTATPTVVPTPAPTPRPTVPVRPGTLPEARQVVPPVRLALPSLDVDMSVIDVGVAETGQMELPDDPAVAGWYRYGADAQGAEGRILIAAHVDAVGYPIGPLARLREVREGETVSIAMADGAARDFEIQSLTYYEKTALPADELFTRSGPAALVIITCGGPFDSATGHYRDNVVAVAVPR